MRVTACLFLALMIVTFSIFSLNLMGKTVSGLNDGWDIIVPDNYDSIQEAINNANDGQTIYVRSGVYPERLVINKTLKIIGESRETTIIQGNGGVLVEILSNNVTFSGFWLRDGETAIYLNEVENCQIIDNKFVNFSRYATYTGGVAIYGVNCSNLTITGNFFTEIDYFNILLTSASNCYIANNTFISTRRMSHAIQLIESHCCVIEWNKIHKSEKPFIFVEGGIGITSSRNIIVRYNDIRDNDWYGISIRNSNDTIIVGNNITEQKIRTGLILSHRIVGAIIYCNNFVGNNEDIVFEGEEEKNVSWNYMGLGNYWDRYEGEDNNYDGIGDTPYTAEGQNDTCPLMGLYHPFKLPDGNIIDVISNSTITEFNYTHNEKITLKVMGEPETSAFCLIKIPGVIQKSLLNVIVNGKTPRKVNVHVNETGNFSLLYILYLHELNGDRIEIIIPEYSLLFLTSLAVLVLPLVLQKRRLIKHLCD